MAKKSSKKNAIDYILLLLVLGFFAYMLIMIVVNWQSFLKIMEEFFQLTKADVYMIPVGVLLFFTFWKVSEKLIFNPALTLIEARENASLGAESAAESALAKANQIEMQLEDRLRASRNQAQSKKLELLQIAKKEAENIRLAAEQTASNDIETARVDLKQQIEKIRLNVKNNSSKIVDQILNKVTS